MNGQPMAGSGTRQEEAEGRVSVHAIAPSASEPADATLLHAVRHGDQHAFEELFERHYARVYAVALRLVGNAEDAEEVAQDVFVKLYRRPLNDSADANVAGWLYRVATHDSFNALRARRRRLNWIQRAARRIRKDDAPADDPLT